jgi:hypothetical protein
MPHFTYSSELDAFNLSQGDLIKRSAEVDEVVKGIHPYFYQQEENKYFIIVTQSCDLYRRNGACSARYITVAAVKSLKVTVGRYMDSVLSDPIQRRLQFGDERLRQMTLQFLDRLFNNNEKEYFFLSKDLESGLSDDYCAFLKLNVPFRAAEHYDVFLRSKILQLSEPFQHKLGYALGNTYSRVGTKDWVPTVYEERKAFDEKLNNVLDQYKGIVWYDNDVYKYIKNELKILGPEEKEQVDMEKIAELSGNYGKLRAQRLKNMIDELGKVMSEVGVDEAMVTTFKKRIKNNTAFTSAIK